MRTPEEKKKMRRIFRKLKEKFTGSETKTELLKRIVIKGFDKVDLIEEYYRMADWAEDKKEKPSLRRFSKWIDNAIEWSKKKEGENLNEIEEYERQKKERQEKEFREHLRRKRALQAKKHRAGN